VRPQLDRERRAGGDPLQRGGEPALAQHRGVDPVGEIAQLGQPQPKVFGRLGEERLRGGAARLRGSALEAQRRQDEALLGAVVQVALESSPGLVCCRDNARSRIVPARWHALRRGCSRARRPPITTRGIPSDQFAEAVLLVDFRALDRFGRGAAGAADVASPGSH
jgi:hypothetical protein